MLLLPLGIQLCFIDATIFCCLRERVLLLLLHNNVYTTQAARVHYRLTPVCLFVYFISVDRGMRVTLNMQNVNRLKKLINDGEIELIKHEKLKD